MRYFLIILSTICSFSLFAQGDRSYVRQGNRQYDLQNFSDAEEDYRKALEDNPSNEKGAHNLGNAIYEQSRYDEAVKHFETAAAMAGSKEGRANALHNLGNTYLQLQQFDKSVKSYIEALKNNPKDLETKYNLAFALQKLKEQQQQEQEQENQENQDSENEDSESEDKEKQENKEQSEEEKEKQEQKDNKEKGEEQSEQEKKEEGEQSGEDENIEQENEQQGEPQPQQMSREEVMKILEVMDNEERKVQEKMRMGKGDKKKTDKDW